MMKSFSAVLIASLLTVTLAFSPTSKSLAVQRVARVSTKMMVDADAFEESDTVGVVFLECDNHECSMVDGYKDNEGWHFENRMNGEAYHTPSPGHSVNVLMVETEDCE